MDMDQKHEQVVVTWPGRHARPQPGAAPDQPAVGEGHRQLCRRDAGREAVFDIADFEAIAAFAGLRPPLRRAV